MKKSSTDRLNGLKLVSRDIKKLRFPTLERPQVPYDNPPTLELMDWATKLYCLSQLSHFRELLKSLIVLSQAEHGPAVFIIARCLYEIAAHSYYVQKHIEQYRQAKDARQGWKFMASINTGSIYMNQRGISASTGPFPQPRDIAKIIRCFDEWRLIRPRGHASDTYSYLSEFAHPNMAAFEHYYEMVNTGEKIFAKFIDPSPDVAREPLANVTIATAATLNCLSILLSLLGEDDLASKLNRSLNSLIKA